MEKIKYPIYIISKNRYQYFKLRRMTWDIFLEKKIPFYLVVEPQEAEFYKKITTNLLILPQNNYGYSTPARNFSWEHSIKMGYQKHWLLDDNIQEIGIRKNGYRIRKNVLKEMLIFAENISDCFEKIGMVGFLENQFLVDRNKIKLITFNTHVYSFMLINNELPFRWRLKRNEDVDLNLQTIFSGYYTLQIRSFFFHKPRTTSLSGGNTTTVYNNRDSKDLKARELKAYWPNIVKIKRRYNRIHHVINWQKFYKEPKINKNFKEKLIILKKIYT